jgi:uncharacterized protein YndB with AHSA1/START domain
LSDAQPDSGASERELVITRVFDAPRELVFQVWTDPAHVARWWGPHGFTTPRDTVEMDVRPGGAWRIGMLTPEGSEYWMRGEYREVVAPERLVFTYLGADLDDVPSREHETLVTITFAELGDKTEMTFRQESFPSKQSRDDHYGGWSECFDELIDYLAELEQAR